MFRYPLTFLYINCTILLYFPKSRYYECVIECIIKYILSKFKYINTYSQMMDKIRFITNTIWCVIIVSLIVILNLLKIDITLQLSIILILMIPLTYVNYYVTKSILVFLVRQEAVSRIADNPPSYPFGMSLPWHAILVTRWCEAHGTMWRRTGP